MFSEDQTGTVVRRICSACSREFTGMTVQSCPHDGNMLMAMPTDPWEGRRLADRYRVDRRLGTGGMGVVYLAWHELMERWVAIKMLKQSFIEDQMSVKRFQQEAKAASRLKHENVITLHEFGVTNTGQPYMVMDYLVGYDKDHPAMSLSQLIKEKGTLPVETVIHIISQACEALDHAHRQGVIHRDIKPANIMVVPTESDPYFVKVVDFGVAKLLPINAVGQAGIEQQGLTQVGEVCGSPVYMSPEQCLGQSLDARADIYSMGIVLFESLTGKLPLLGKSMVETMQKHMVEAPPSFKEAQPNVYVPAKVEEVTMRALAKKPHERQQTMSQLAQELRFSIPRPGQTTNLRTHEVLTLDSAEEKKGAWLLPAIGGGVAAIALMIAGVWFLAPHGVPNHKPKTAQAATAKAPVAAVAPAVPSKGTASGGKGSADAKTAAEQTPKVIYITKWKSPPTAPVRTVVRTVADSPVAYRPSPPKAPRKHAPVKLADDPFKALAAEKSNSQN